MSQLRDYERESIRAFVQSAADEGYLSGRVLDYGCGKQPYRDIVEAAGGESYGYDMANFPANVSGEDVGEYEEAWFSDDAFDAILCTQVVQYIPLGDGRHGHTLPTIFATWQREVLAASGLLVMTYPTNWPEVEDADLHRFTRAGMERLLTDAGFTIVEHEPRVWVYATAAIIPTPGGKQGPIDDAGTAFALGYGVIARA